MIIQETPTLNLQFDKAKNDSDMLSLLKSQGGTFTRGSEVVGSGDSVASYVDALGTLRYAKLGHPRPNFVDGVNQGLLIEESRTNLLLRSEDFENAVWLKTNATVTPNATTAPDGTLTADKIVESAVLGDHFFRQDTTNFTGFIVSSIFLKKAERSRVLLLNASSGAVGSIFNLESGSIISNRANTTGFIKEINNGWYKCTIVTNNSAGVTGVGLRVFLADNSNNFSYTGDGTSGVFIWGGYHNNGVNFPTSYIPTKSTFVSRASTATYFDQNGVLQTAAINEARDNNHGFINGKWVKTGLLAEEARTNLALMSNDFSDGAWLKVALGTGTGLVLTPNYTTAPDGSNNGWRLQCNLNGGNTTNDRSWLQQNITGTTVPTYASVYAKLNSAGSATFTVSNNGTDTVTLTSTSWVRVGTVRTAAAAAYAFRIGLIGGQGASDSIDISIAFAQIEVGFQPSSYIPTAGTTITRSADITTSATVTRGAETSNRLSATDIINQTEGTLYAKLFVSSGISKANRRILSINEDNAELQSVYLRLSGTNQPQLIVFNTTVQVAISGSAVSGEVKIVGTYKENEFKLFVNGVKIGQDLTGTLPSFNRINFAQQSTNELNDPLAKAVLYPKALTETQAILLSRI